VLYATIIANFYYYYYYYYSYYYFIFQVASIRVLVSLMSSCPGVYQEFLDTQVDKLALFCLCRRAKSLAPCHTATEVLQILFDFAVSDIGEPVTLGGGGVGDILPAVGQDCALLPRGLPLGVQVMA
jgi:hypothetical protein